MPQVSRWTSTSFAVSFKRPLLTSTAVNHSGVICSTGTTGSKAVFMFLGSWLTDPGLCPLARRLTTLKEASGKLMASRKRADGPRESETVQRVSRENELIQRFPLFTLFTSTIP